MWLAPVMIIGLFMLRGIFTFAMNYAMNYVSQEVLLDLRRDMFTRLVEMPIKFFAMNSSGTVIARLVSDVQNVTQTLSSVMIILVRDTFVIIGLLGWLLYLNWQLTTVALILIPLVGLAVGSFSRRMRRLSSEQIRYTGQLTGVVEEAIHSNPVVKVYGGQSYERARFAAASGKLRDFARRMTVASALIVPITQIMAAVAVSVVISIALYQSQHDRTTVGDFVSFITAMLMILAPLKHLADVNSQLQRALAAGRRGISLHRRADRGRRRHRHGGEGARRDHVRARDLRLRAVGATCAVGRRTCTYRRVRRWRWWAAPAAARRRWPTSCRASIR
jgi:subfamily B ATP-binding cassette protein MsbA